MLNIDERIEKLTERHEALTQTVEIIAAMQKETDRRLGQVLEAITRIPRRQA
jgi:hypothetical protein